MEHNQAFEYTYSAGQRQEIEAIRKKYLPKEEDKMEQLRRLHAIPTRKAQAASIVIGILGTLILVALAYPLYNFVLRGERRRIAPEILRLSEELLR